MDSQKLLIYYFIPLYKGESLVLIPNALAKKRVSGIPAAGRD